MLTMITSAKLFFRGPLWAAAGGLGLVSMAIGFASGNLWLWLTVGLAFAVAAAFTSYHRGRVAQLDRARSLPHRIDDLQREGMNLIADLATPVPPTRTKDGNVSIQIGAPSERWDRAEDFTERARGLLVDGIPALLMDYTAGFNECRHRTRAKEGAGAPDPETDDRSDAVKMEEFVAALNGRPAELVEANLEGLSFARRRLLSGPVPHEPDPGLIRPR